MVFFSLIDKFNLSSDEIDDLFNWLKAGGTVMDEQFQNEEPMIKNDDLIENIKNVSKRRSD